MSLTMAFTMWSWSSDGLLASAPVEPLFYHEEADWSEVWVFSSRVFGTFVGAISSAYATIVWCYLELSIWTFEPDPLEFIQNQLTC